MILISDLLVEQVQAGLGNLPASIAGLKRALKIGALPFLESSQVPFENSRFVFKC